MKKVILGSLILMISLSGCFSEDDKKAKDIAVKKMIESDKKETSFKSSIKKVDDRDFSNAFSGSNSFNKTKTND